MLAQKRKKRMNFLLRWLRLFRTAGTPEGCRESTRLSYDQHLEGAFKGKAQPGDRADHAALYGALASWYKVRGMPVREVLLWGELAPFLMIPESIAREAIAEYTVYLETPAEAKRDWLADLINNGLRAASAGAESPRSMALVGFMNQVAWCRLLGTDVRETFDAEAQKLAERLHKTEDEHADGIGGD
jgi:hypothetical protein